MCIRDSSDTTASTTGPSYEDEDAWLSWEDYGECSNTVKDFYNYDEKKTYYYEMDEAAQSKSEGISAAFAVGTILRTRSRANA